MKTSTKSKWDLDWAHPRTTGTDCMARNLMSPTKTARRWHLVATGYLRQTGIKTPIYRKDSWEIDWTQRKEKLVLARNMQSKMPQAREWHYVDFHTIEAAGLTWKPRTIRTGRTIDSQGYINLRPTGMTQDEILVAKRYGLFLGSKFRFAKEHRLVAYKLWGKRVDGKIVRHINGNKTDNRPENLILGTPADNRMDHHQAQINMMRWRDAYCSLAKHYGLLSCDVEPSEVCMMETIVMIKQLLKLHGANL